MGGAKAHYDGIGRFRHWCCTARSAHKSIKLLKNANL